MTQHFVAFTFVCCCLSSMAWAQGDQVTAPDPAEIIQAGQASMKRLETESASWTTRTIMPTGTDFIVDVTLTPYVRSTVISVEAQGRRQELARVTMTADVWYVVQSGRSAKYRPFEAPFDVPSTYVYLNRSEVKFVAEAAPGSLGNFEGLQGQIATYRSPLADATRQLLQTSVTQFERLQRENPAAMKPEVAKAIEQSKELLANGVSTQVDLKTGMLVEFGTPNHRSKVTRFRWLKDIDPKEFFKEEREWEDFTNDPTVGDRHELVMLGHSGIWQPGVKSHETDGRLVELGSNRSRRIPFPGDLVTPGCFTKDRTRVIVTGLDTVTTLMGLYEIDLKTTENRRLGGDALSTGLTLFPTLSPDGKTVAVMHQEPSGHVLRLQTFLVDVASGAARTLGEPGDIGPISWFPDGKNLLLFERDRTDRSKPPVETISRMDLDGQVTKIGVGGMPAILGDGTRILFQDINTRTWKTCDLNGGEIQDYADGLKGHNYPAPSSDGKRLLMMHFEAGKAPVPVIFDVGSSEGKPLKLPTGLWGLPAWK